MRDQFKNLNDYIRQYKEKLCLSKKEALCNESDLLKLDYKEYYKLKDHLCKGYDPFIPYLESKRDAITEIESKVTKGMHNPKAVSKE